MDKISLSTYAPVRGLDNGQPFWLTDLAMLGLTRDTDIMTRLTSGADRLKVVRRALRRRFTFDNSRWSVAYRNGDFFVRYIPKM